MNACMHDYAKENRKHGVVKSIMLESRINTPFGKDYGSICTSITGSTKYPKFSTTFEYLSGDGSTPIPTIQEYSRLTTTLRPKRPRWVKGN